MKWKFTDCHQLLSCLWFIKPCCKTGVHENLTSHLTYLDSDQVWINIKHRIAQHNKNIEIHTYQIELPKKIPQETHTSQLKQILISGPGVVAEGWGKMTIANQNICVYYGVRHQRQGKYQEVYMKSSELHAETEFDFIHTEEQKRCALI